MCFFFVFFNCGDACRSSSYPLKGNWSLPCIHSWHSSHITHLSHCLTFILLSSSFINHKGFLKRACGWNLKRVFPLHMRSVYDFKHCLINSNYQVLFLAIVKVLFTFVLNLGSFQFDGESALPHELRGKVFTSIYWVIILFCRQTYVMVHRNVEVWDRGLSFIIDELL